MKTVALLSGGLDSTVATAAAQRDSEIVLALTLDYRQRARAKEIDASRRIARRLGIRHRVVRLDFLGEVTTSALVNRSDGLPFLSADLLDQAEATSESMRGVWVPNRNGLFVAIAASFAEGLEADRIVAGFNREEAASFPDNSMDFVARTNAALSLSTLSGVRLAAPTIELDKQEIVQLGYELGAPLNEIWSCYEGGTRHCRGCESCLRLLRAIESAGVRERFLEEWKEAGENE